MSEALIPLESVNAVEVFTGGKLDDLLARIRAEAVTLVPDLSTVASRKEIASVAYKVARSKTAAVERAEREAREAKERATREAAEAEQRAKEAAERAEREKAEAVAAAERRAQEEADRVERERQAAAEAQRKADEARAADVEHRRTINREAVAALVAAGLSEEAAATAITAIVQGKVPAVAIRY